MTDENIDEMIGKLRDQQAAWNVVERAANDGDKVTIDYAGTKDGEAFDGGSASDTDLELGSGRMIDGFEAGLVGASAGEERTLDLQFPDDYHAEDLRSAKVQFAVTVKAVKEKELPELNDEFFARYDVQEGGLEAFQKNVRESMEKQLADAVDAKVKQQVVDGLLDLISLDLPQVLVKNEIAALKAQSLSQFGVMGDQTFDESLLPDDLFSEQAEKRVATGVILNQVAQVNNIRPDRDKVLEFIGELAETYEDPNEVRDYYLGDEARMQQIQMIVVEKLVVEHILAEAEIIENSCTYDEAVSAE